MNTKFLFSLIFSTFLAVASEFAPSVENYMGRYDRMKEIATQLQSNFSNLNPSSAFFHAVRVSSSGYSVSEIISRYSQLKQKIGTIDYWLVADEIVSSPLGIVEAFDRMNQLAEKILSTPDTSILKADSKAIDMRMVKRSQLFFAINTGLSIDQIMAKVVSIRNIQIIEWLNKYNQGEPLTGNNAESLLQRETMGAIGRLSYRLDNPNIEKIYMQLQGIDTHPTLSAILMPSFIKQGITNDKSFTVWKARYNEIDRLVNLPTEYNGYTRSIAVAYISLASGSAAEAVARFNDISDSANVFIEKNKDNKRDLLWKNLSAQDFAKFTSLDLSGQEFVRLYSDLGQKMKTDRFVEFPNVSTMNSEAITVLEVLRKSH